MRIGITLNEVLRDYLSQFEYVCDKYVKKSGTFDDFENLYSAFKFESKDAMNDFIYLEHPLEVLGHADLTSEYVMVKLNEFIANIDPDEHEVVILSREVGGGIPATFFFLSKTLCKVKNVTFLTRYEDKWDHCDVLFTANPRALNNKPEGKIAVKVEAPYNKDCEADFTIQNLTDFLVSEELQDQILNS